MKRKTVVFSVFAAIVLISGFAFYSSSPAEENPPASQQPAAAEEFAAAINEESVEGERPEKYILGVYDGYIAIYVPNKIEKPQTITAIDVRTLPKYDREALGRGVPVYSETELYSYLEDFGS